MQAHFRSMTTWLANCCLVLSLFIVPSAQAEIEEITNLLTGQGGAETEKAEQAPPDRVIDTDTNAVDDRKIRERLRKIYSELDTMQDVRITDVSSGVVTLEGEVGTAAVQARAVQFARQVDGVVEVQNNLSIDRTVKSRLQQTLDKVKVLGRDVLANLPVLLLALGIIIAFWFSGAWLSRRQSLFRKIAPNAFIANLLSQIIKLIFIILGIVLALVLLDATPLIGTILGAAGIIGLAVSFAVRDTVENYIASILLSVRHPFAVNDLIKIQDYQGRVARLTSRATVLISLDGNSIRIPNATVFKAIIINYTRQPERRFEFTIGVDTAHDLLEVQTIAEQVIANQAGILQEPKPAVIIQDIGDSNVILNISAWVNQDHHDLFRVRSETIRQIKETFDNAGIVMPEPIYKLRIKDAAGTRITLSETEVAPKDKESNHLSPSEQSAEKPPVPSEERQADISVDTSIEDQIAKEQAQDDSSNLLKADAPQE